MYELMNNDALGKLIVRLSVGILMLFHGASKLLHPGSVDFIGSTLAGAGIPEVIAYGVYVGEVLAPLMIIVGLYSRIGGLLIAINMMFAILLMHSGDLLALTEHGGWRLELQAFYLFGAVAIIFLGSGKLAVKPD
ncbi:MAG: DoxX family protein [Gammaproteobacteria bacterium]